MKLSLLYKIIKKIKKIKDILLPCQVEDFLLRKYFKGTFLSQVEFHLVDYCNLNCACCDHFSPLAPKKNVPVCDVISDFKKLKKIFDNVGKILILGGEPLLHPNLLEIFEPLKEIYPKSELVIITNGILLDSMNEDFWLALKKYNVTLSMTKYPIKVDYGKFLNKCLNMGIKSYFFNENKLKMYKMNLDYKAKNDKYAAYKLCWHKNCHFLRDSKLYLCTPAPNIGFLNKHFNLDFKLTKRDYIDLDKVKSATKINRIFSKPIDFCKYCSDKPLEWGEYSHSKKELSEWVKVESLK